MANIAGWVEDGLEAINVGGGKGRGVVTTRPFDKGEFVCEYAGDLVTMEEASERERAYSKCHSVGCYMFYFEMHKEKWW